MAPGASSRAVRESEDTPITPASFTAPALAVPALKRQEGRQRGAHTTHTLRTVPLVEHRVLRQLYASCNDTVYACDAVYWYRSIYTTSTHILLGVESVALSSI